MTINQLTELITKLHALLQNPQPGLQSWGAMVGECLEELEEVNKLEPPPKTATPTPGSWTVYKTNPMEVYSSFGRLATTEGSVGVRKAEARANARLIAAAPELLAVTRGVVIARQYPRGSEAQVRCLEEVEQDARAAIAKVEGETK